MPEDVTEAFREWFINYGTIDVLPKWLSRYEILEDMLDRREFRE